MPTTDWTADSWLASVVPCIQEVQGLLAEELSDEPSTLYEQLTKAETWYPRLTKIQADASARLSVAEYTAMMQADAETAKGKELQAKAAVAGQRRMVDILKGLSESIKNRIILGCSLRKTNAGERSDF